ncbi:MAG: glycosyltransferase, partial [Anaerolineales bacterium]
ILLLNPDTQVEPGAIGQMSRFLDDNQSAGAVGPMLLGLDGAMQQSASPAPSLLRELSRMFRIDGLLPSATYDTKRWDMDRPHEVDVLQGACFMLRRDSLEQVGLLDEDYFMYSEEVDLCYRLRKAGWSIHWLPQAKVMHHGGQSSKQVPVESFLNLYKGKITYFRKQHGMATAFAYKLILATASIARLMVSPLALLDQRERRDRHLALAGRYRRLLMELPSL